MGAFGWRKLVAAGLGTFAIGTTLFVVSLIFLAKCGGWGGSAVCRSIGQRSFLACFWRQPVHI